MTGLEPGGAEWRKRVSASKVAAILGLSKWESPWSMWHQMKGTVEPPPPNAAMERGHDLEDAVVGWFVRQHPGLVEYARQPIDLLGHWAMATPDLVGMDEFGNRFVMDAKTDHDDDDWWAFDDQLNEFVPALPAYYLVQVMWQLALRPDATVAYVAVLFAHPTFVFREFVVERDEVMIAAMLRRCREFYDSLAADTPPPLDTHVATYETARRMHKDIEPRDVTVDEADAERFVLAHAAMELAEAELNYVRSHMLTTIGKARRAVTVHGRVIARRQKAGRGGIALHRVAPIPKGTDQP